MAEASIAVPVQIDLDNEVVYRKNFPYFLVDALLFIIAMGIIGPATVIPDFVRRLTNSEILIGLSGYMFDFWWALPQLFIARYIVGFEKKKWWFIGPNIPVRFVILIFAGIILALGADQKPAILVAFFICYGIAAFGDGLVGVPWADLTGTSLNEKWRARMFGISTAITGLLMLGVSQVVKIILSDAGPGFPDNYALIFGAAGAIFAVSILPIIFVKELPGAKRVEKIPAMSEFLPALGHVLRTDSSFRSMIIVRMLFSLFSVAGIFYVGFATVQLHIPSDEAVGNLLLSGTIGAIVGAIIYTWLGARNNLLFMRLALAGALLVPVCGLLALLLGPTPLYVGSLISGITVGNLVLCIQNWVVSYPSAEQRPIYAGLFNTCVAAISLIAPIIAGLIVQEVGFPPLFVVSFVMGIGALFVVTRYVKR